MPEAEAMNILRSGIEDIISGLTLLKVGVTPDRKQDIQRTVDAAQALRQLWFGLD